MQTTSNIDDIFNGIMNANLVQNNRCEEDLFIMMNEMELLLIKMKSKMQGFIEEEKRSN